MKTKQIKRFTFALIAITLIALLGACSSNGGINTKPSLTESPLEEDGFEELTSGIGDNGELEAEVDITIINRLGASSLITQQTNSPQPVILEFRAKTKKDRTFKGVLISASEHVNELDLREMQLKAQVLKTPDGTRFMLGTASAKQSNTKIAWSFIGVGRKKSLPGPLVGTQFMFDGEVQLKALCRKDNLTGRGLLLPTHVGTEVATAVTAFKPATFPCEEPRFQGLVGAYTQAEIINTHIGPLLSGQGTLHFDETTRPMAMYYLGVAVLVSERQEIAGFTGEFKDSVIPVDPFMLAEVAEIRPDGTMVFDNAVGGLKRLEVGSVLASKPTPRAPHGFMRRVTNIRHRNNKLIVKTEQAGLSDLIASGGFNVKRDLDMVDLESFTPLQPGVTMATPSVSQLSSQAVDILPIAPININVVVIDLDGNHATTDDQVRVEATLTLDATVEAVFECGGFLCTDPFFDSTFTFEETLEISVIGELNKAVAKSMPLFTMSFGAIPVAPLVVVVPTVTIILQLDGNIQVSFEYHVEQSFTAEAGLKFDNGSWSTHSSVDKSFEADDPEVSGSMDAKARLALKGALMINGIVGMSADVGPYVLLEAQYPGDPTWGLYFGIDSYVYAELNLIVWKKSYPITQIFDKQWTIKEASDTPPVVQSITINGSDLLDGFDSPFERAIKNIPSFFEVTTYDDQDGATCCTVEYESDLEGYLGSTSNQNVHEHEITFSKAGLHTITLLVTDSFGNSTSTNFELDVLGMFGGTVKSRCFGFAVSYYNSRYDGSDLLPGFQAEATNWGDREGCEDDFDPATAEYNLYWYANGEDKGESGSIRQVGEAVEKSIKYMKLDPGVYLIKAHAVDARDGSLASTNYMTYVEPAPPPFDGVTKTWVNEGGPLVYGNVFTEDVVHVEVVIDQYNGEDYEITWRTDLDGFLGTGTSVELAFDSSGWRTITANVINKETGASKEFSQEIFVSEPSVFSDDGYMLNNITCRFPPSC